MVKDHHSESKRGNLLLPRYGLFFPINNVSQDTYQGICYTRLEQEIGPPGGIGPTIKLSEYWLLRERERNVLFNDAHNTFYLRLYGVGHMVKDHSDSERGNPLPPHRLLLSINNKGSFICTIPQTG